MDDMQEMLDSLTDPTSVTRQDDKEPPPPATPLEFPRCEPSKLSVPEVGVTDDLVKLFSNSLRTGPTIKIFQALNASIANELPLGQVVPTDFIPEPSWSEDSATSESSESCQVALSRSKLMSNGAPAPGKGEFLVRVKELLYDNEDGFCAIQRRSRLPNRQPAGVAHFRRFWEGVLLLSEYWDTSLDKYTDNEDTKDTSNTDMNERRSETTDSEPKMETDKGGDLKRTYTGRRTGTGRDMPGKYREETVFAFVEAISSAFHCRLEKPQVPQKFQLQGTMIPILYAASIHRIPKDVRAVRRGVAEGPMLGVFCRGQTSFRGPDEAEGEGKEEILDLLRETGFMLMLAQKRAREGKEEVVPGKGKWWATAPRWGGGAGGELGDANEETTGGPKPSGSSRNRVRKTRGMDAWKILEPPSGIWERGVTYQQIGKDKNSEHDDVSGLEADLRFILAVLRVTLSTRFTDQHSRSFWSHLSTTTFLSSTYASISNTSTISNNLQLSPKSPTHRSSHGMHLRSSDQNGLIFSSQTTEWKQ